MSFFERLREERERLNLNQTAFAAIGGVLKGAQINYESGKRKPDIEYLEGLSKVGVDVLYIITGQRMGEPSETPVMTDDESVLLKHYRAAPEPVRNAALAVLLSGGHAPEGINTKKERKGRAAPKKSKNTVVVGGDNTGNVAGGDIIS